MLCPAPASATLWELGNFQGEEEDATEEADCYYHPVAAEVVSHDQAGVEGFVFALVQVACFLGIPDVDLLVTSALLWVQAGERASCWWAWEGFLGLVLPVAHWSSCPEETAVHLFQWVGMVAVFQRMGSLIEVSPCSELTVCWVTLVAFYQAIFVGAILC